MIIFLWTERECACGLVWFAHDPITQVVYFKHTNEQKGVFYLPHSWFVVSLFEHHSMFSIPVFNLWKTKTYRLLLLLLSDFFTSTMGTMWGLQIAKLPNCQCHHNQVGQVTGPMGYSDRRGLANGLPRHNWHSCVLCSFKCSSWKDGTQEIYACGNFFRI